MNPTNFPNRMKAKRLKALEQVRRGKGKEPGSGRTEEQRQLEIKKLEELTK
jgi:hypothetical protein